MDGEKAVVVVWAEASSAMSPAHLASFFKVCGPIAAIACSPKEPKAGICFKEAGARKMALLLDRGIVGYVPVRVYAFSAQQHPDLGLALQTALADPAYRLPPSPASSPSASPSSLATAAPVVSASTTRAAAQLRPQPSVPPLPPTPSSASLAVPSSSAAAAGSARSTPVSSPRDHSPRVSPREAIASISEIGPEDHNFGVVISNLSTHCTPDMLYEFFILCGHIEDIVIFSALKEEEVIDAVMLFEVEYSANMALSLSGAVVAGSVVSVARLSSVVVNKLAQDYRLSSAACWERKRASNRAAHQATAAEPAADKPSGAAQVVPHLDLAQAKAKSKPKRTIGESDDDEEDDAEIEEEEEREIDDFSPRPAATSPEAASGAAVPKSKESSHSKVQFDVENAALFHEGRGALFNLRDLATVYVSPDRFLRQGRIYRSAAWARYSHLRTDDFRAASDYVRKVLGIKTIIDLRSGEEKSMDAWYQEVEIFYRTAQTPAVPRTASTLNERRRVPVNLVSRNLKVQLFATSSTSIKWKMFKSAFSSSSSSSPPSASSASADRARRKPGDGKSKLFLGLNFYDLQNFQIPGSKRQININVDAAAQMFLSEVITPMGLEGFTKLFVMYAKDEIGSALRICADPRNYPILIHCTSGKDRTGLIVALVMTVCGVDRTEVVENYHLSERFLDPIAHEIREENGKKGLGESFDGTPRPLIRNILEFIDAKWGSVPDYLHNACNFTYDEQTRLRKNLLRSRILAQLDAIRSSPSSPISSSSVSSPLSSASSSYHPQPHQYQHQRPAPPVPPPPMADRYAPLVPLDVVETRPRADSASSLATAGAADRAPPVPMVPLDHTWPSPLPPVPPRPWQSAGDLLTSAGQKAGVGAPPPLPARPHAALQSSSASAPTSPAGDHHHLLATTTTSASAAPPPLPARPHQQQQQPTPAAAVASPPLQEKEGEKERKEERKEQEAKEEEEEKEQEKGEEKEETEDELDEETRARAVRVTGLPPFMATAEVAHFFVFSGRIERLRHERAEGCATVIYASKSALQTALHLDHALVSGRSVRVLPLPSTKGEK